MNCERGGGLGGEWCERVRGRGYGGGYGFDVLDDRLAVVSFVIGRFESVTHLSFSTDDLQHSPSRHNLRDISKLHALLPLAILPRDSQLHLQTLYNFRVQPAAAS